MPSGVAGSIMFICQPVGSVLSGIVLEQLGRKKSMILVNFPHVIGWFIYYFASSVPMLYLSAVIMGLGVGFMEAPIITYVGEISQPQLRGILTSYSGKWCPVAGMFVQLGFFLEFLLGTVSNWRTAAAISAAVPIATVIAITQVPETPIWLLSRGRFEEAEKSLCWLRGWVSPAAVSREFNELVLYTEKMKRLKHGPPKSAEGDDAERVSPSDVACREGVCVGKIRQLLKPQTLRPLSLVLMFFFFQHASGFTAMRPYLVQVFDEFGLPLDAHWVTVLTGVVGLVGNIVCMVGVSWCGKRPLSLVSMAVASMASLLLGAYAFAVLSPGDVATGGTRHTASWTPLTLFVVYAFMQNTGVQPIPWMILSEVFPFRSRGLASGTAAAGSYILAFLASKTFLSLKSALGLHGVFWLYGSLGFVGFFAIYWTFSETEGRSLEDIEEFYKKGIRGKIPKKEISERVAKESSTKFSPS
ncbi:Solute carrier family 2, facilitated glucose transporter member 6, partial [Zootermopsis nevadensis]